jgi:hypothetical protein
MAKNITFLGYFAFTKNHNDLSKVAQLSKKVTQIGHPARSEPGKFEDKN